MYEIVARYLQYANDPRESGQHRNGRPEYFGGR